MTVAVLCAENALDFVLARLNSYRTTKVDAAEMAGWTDTIASSIFFFHSLYL